MSSEPSLPIRESTHPGFRRRGRIVYTLLAVLVFIGLAPLATVSWKLIDINREALTTAQQEYQLLLVSAIAHELDINVEGLGTSLRRLARTLGGAYRSSSDEQIGKILEVVVDDHMPYLRYTYFRGKDFHSNSAGRLPDKLEPLFDAGLREAAELLAGTPDEVGREARLSSPIVLDEKPPRSVMVVSAPVVSGGRFRGVLFALVDLKQVWDSVVARHRTGHVVFALDREGRVFASTNTVRVRPGADATDSELVQRFLRVEGRGSETVPFTRMQDGVETHHLGSYQVSGQDWGIFVQAARSDVYLPIQRMIRSTLNWAIAALGLAIVAAMIFARTLSGPTKRLAAASRAFASGHFATRVEVRSGNEIGELAYTFNTMAAEIEDHIRRLRQAAEENRELFLGTIRALAQAIDAKDPYTRGHSVRVNRYSVILARELDLDERQIADIHVASLMHDVGKIGIDDGVLKKPGQLTDEEFELMKTHTTLGANIMAPIRRMKRMIPGLRWHHERWRGGGYPDGLAGKEIPLMARIIAVADAFDAMTTHRPYQTAMTFPRALQRLNELKTTSFEERIVEAFNRAYQKGLIRPGSDEDEVKNISAQAS